MTTSVLTVAKRLGEQSNWSLSNLAMQKLSYIAHMAHLASYEGEPLIFGNFEAWDLGPVHPQLYHAVKKFGADPVQDVFQSILGMEDGDTAKLVDDVVRHLSDNTTRLVSITHWDKGAWAKHYIPGNNRIVIPNEDILQEWEDRISEQRNSS